jgi:putative ABC transport system ATP-binding protein
MPNTKHINSKKSGSLSNLLRQYTYMAIASPGAIVSAINPSIFSVTNYHLPGFNFQCAFSTIIRRLADKIPNYQIIIYYFYPMLTTNHLIKYFNQNTPNEVLAIDDCSLDIPTGEFVVVIGSNGSGKSTLLNLIAGTFLPDSGTISIGDVDVTKKKDFERSKWVARVFQDPMAGTAPNLTILDNFRLAAIRTQSKKFKTGINTPFKEKVKERLTILGLGLENKTNTLVGKLSGGQRQALTLLMSVMDDARILLLDEPTAALDPKSSDIIMQLSEKIISSMKLTALLVTHNMNQATQYGSRLLMMRNGVIERDMASQEKSKLNSLELQEWFL